MAKYTQKSFDRSLLLKLSKAGDFLHEENDPMVWARFSTDLFTWYIIAYFPRTTYCYRLLETSGLQNLGYDPVQLMEGIHAKRDLLFKPCRLSELKPNPFKFENTALAVAPEQLRKNPKM